MNFLSTLQSLYDSAEYPVIIKTVVPINERFLNILFYHLQKYKLIGIEKPYKTILHKHPQDFGHLEYAEVYIIKAYLKLPVAPHILREELAMLLKIPLEDIVVKTAYEGLEQNHEFMNTHDELDRKAEELGLEKGSNLSTNPHYRSHESPVPQELMAGNGFVERFKQYAATKMKQQQPKLYRSNQADKMFGMLYDLENKSQYDNDFNSHIKDSPKVYPKDKNYDLPAEEMAAERELMGNWGSFWRRMSYSKPYKTKDGKEVELYYTPDAIEMLRKKYGYK